MEGPPKFIVEYDTTEFSEEIRRIVNPNTDQNSEWFLDTEIAYLKLGTNTYISFSKYFKGPFETDKVYSLEEE